MCLSLLYRNDVVVGKDTISLLLQYFKHHFYQHQFDLEDILLSIVLMFLLCEVVESAV